ncbi:MAG: DUF3883 domain-containing protein [Actinomycetia bacterium]|nr:DUF3883 domain-containing protein [Actinomycetes bacterium]
MAELAELAPDAVVIGLDPAGPVTLVQVIPHGPGAATVVYRDAAGTLRERVVFAAEAAAWQVEPPAARWPADADPALFRLALEAQRIRYAHLFDPYLAVSTAAIEPLPHQILAVYGELLPRQPIRFLLADDPGAGKTIMTGLLIKELLIRGALRRCLIVCPGSLVPQWQAELEDKFGLVFTVFEPAHARGPGNPFQRHDWCLARLDHLARNAERFRPWLEEAHWDLVVVDEAHKLAAHWRGDDFERTARRRVAEILLAPERAAHVLLLTATPHNGKDEEFYALLGLLDADRFTGRIRGDRRPDVRDLLRRLSKEQLVRFDGRPLFPPRFAHTAAYRLSDPEQALYDAVTQYVRTGLAQAEALPDRKRGLAVGLALTVLQRRVASSPAAIARTLERRLARLQALLRAPAPAPTPAWADAVGDPADWDDEDWAAGERETWEDAMASEATAARTRAELAAEVAVLEGLVAQARAVEAAGVDSKWRELSALLQTEPLLRRPDGHREKLIVFTEHRDTLAYLAAKIRDLLGDPGAVVTIQGGLDRAVRRQVEQQFQEDPAVTVLVATDAAGEGVNLQRAHLVINYDLPWNPNRLEQRFGRVHRIGQDHPCHMWSLMAEGTREAAVFATLLRKLEAIRGALPGAVFDVLGPAFAGRSLRDLLLDAIRHGDDPAAHARIAAEVDRLTDLDRLRALAAEQALATDTLDAGVVAQVRADLERAQAQRLQPHHIGTFFRAAFARLGGACEPREPGRWEIPHVPFAVRERARALGGAPPVVARYARVTFEPARQRVPGAPEATLLAPGHPLFDAVLDLTLEAGRGALQRGAVLVAPNDPRPTPYRLAAVTHAVVDGTGREIARQVAFLAETPDGWAPQGPAPHLDLRPPTPAERAAWDAAGLAGAAPPPDAAVTAQLLATVVPAHLEAVRARHTARLDRIRRAVHERLQREIAYWDSRAARWREEAAAGRQPRVNPMQAARRAQELEARLAERTRELERAAAVAPTPPTVLTVAWVVPAGWLAAAAGAPAPDAADRAALERLALAAVLAQERALGHDPVDVSAERRGYDVESRTPAGDLRFLEVKGRAAGQDTVTVTRNEIATALNAPERFWLVVVPVADGRAGEPVYIPRPFQQAPDFGVESVTYNWRELAARAAEEGPARGASA